MTKGHEYDQKAFTQLRKEGVDILTPMSKSRLEEESRLSTEEEENLKQCTKKEIKRSQRISFFLTTVFYILMIASGYHTLSFFQNVAILFWGAIISAFFIGHLFRERMSGRAVIGGMNNPFAIASGSGITFFLSGLSLFIWQMEFKYLSAIIVFSTILSFHLIYKGFMEGPVYGWD